ncbi:hypothetical protein HH299_08520 [Xanthomonas sp. Kuri4-2]
MAPLAALVLVTTLAGPACPVERADYRLRGAPGTTLHFIARDTPGWPSNLLARLDLAATGRSYWWLPWNGGSDGRQHLASVRPADRPGWSPPAPDDGQGRPLGDIDYLATDADYDVLDHVPVRGEPAPAHILLPDLDEALWYRNGAEPRDHAPRQFFDLMSCHPMEGGVDVPGA